MTTADVSALVAVGAAAIGFVLLAGEVEPLAGLGAFALAGLAGLAGVALAFADRRAEGGGLRLGRNMGALAAAVLAFGAVLAIVPRHQDHHPEVQVRQAAVAARMGLEQYATDKYGEYPPVADWLGELRRLKALPGDGLPPVPWADSAYRQANAPRLPASLPGAAALARGAKLPYLETRLGPGHPATSSEFDAMTWGAILYDHDPKTQTWVLYGVGKRRGDAILIFGETNAGGYRKATLPPR